VRRAGGAPGINGGAGGNNGFIGGAGGAGFAGNGSDAIFFIPVAGGGIGDDNSPMAFDGGNITFSFLGGFGFAAGGFGGGGQVRPSPSRAP
jgi:fibronectin-binding autotransporter adhesin